MEPAGREAPRAGARGRIGKASVLAAIATTLAAGVAAPGLEATAPAPATESVGAAADGAAPELVSPDLAAPDLAAPDLAAPEPPASELPAPDLAAYDLTTADLAVSDLPTPDAAPSMATHPQAAAPAESPILLWLGLSAAVSWGATLYFYRRWGRGSAGRPAGRRAPPIDAPEPRSAPSIPPEARLAAAADELVLATGRLNAIAAELERRHRPGIPPAPAASPAPGARRRFTFLDAGATDDGEADAAEPRGLFELESARSFADQEPGPRRARRAKPSSRANRRRPAAALAGAEALEMTALGIGDAEASEYGG
jgi:hypothetical protein